MESFQIKTTKNQFVITVDKSLVNLDFIKNFFSRVRVEELVKKANFKKDIIGIAKEVKKDWWKKNKDKYLVK
jgi:hypothetical protein